MPRRRARSSGQTSALPCCPARAATARAPWARTSFLFHSAMAQQLLPDTAAQKPGNVPLCQGPVPQLHLAGIWQGSQWGLTRLATVGICSSMDVPSAPARGSWGSSLCQPRAEGSQAPPVCPLAHGQQCQPPSQTAPSEGWDVLSGSREPTGKQPFPHPLSGI